jgi:hypothetical protein
MALLVANPQKGGLLIAFIGDSIVSISQTYPHAMLQPGQFDLYSWGVAETMALASINYLP